MVFQSKNEAETAHCAESLISEIQIGKPLLLNGNLGTGKSVFARALIRRLTNQPDLDVPSPTFTLVQHYDSAKGPIVHFDLYRLEDPEEIYELGWEEALAEAIVIVEWPERLGALKPTRYLDIHIESVEDEPSTRIIEVTDHEPQDS